MMRSMYSGVTGLKNHQIRMDAIGNNIANVNTVGYKASRVTFQDTLNQTLRGASAPNGTRGGINAVQVGLGMNLSSIDVLHTQGNLQNTGKITDCAIQGDGFFVLSDGGREYYTRAGNFNLERDGRLVNASNGMIVRGWLADKVGNIDTNTPLDNIQIPVGQTIAPIATTEITYGGNLEKNLDGLLKYDALSIASGLLNATLEIKITPVGFNQYEYVISTASPLVDGFDINGDGVFEPATGTITLDLDGEVLTNSVPTFEVYFTDGTVVDVTGPVAGDPEGGTFETTAVPAEVAAGSFTQAETMVTITRVYDSLGSNHNLTTTLTKTGVNEWDWVCTNDGGVAVGSGHLIYSTTGELISSTGGNISFTPTGARPVTIVPDFSNVTQYSGALLDPRSEDYDPTVPMTEITSPFQDGYPMGELQSINIDKSGIIVGVFSNGMNQDLGQLAMANFTNPGGLSRSGDTLFSETSNSGAAQIGVAGRNGRGLITPGAVEMANVDLSQEFTDMIVNERGFQSNSRVITTSDEMLQELVNLKR